MPNSWPRRRAIRPNAAATSPTRAVAAMAEINTSSQRIADVHVVAILFYLFYDRNDLTRPMLSGRQTNRGEVGNEACTGVAAVDGRGARHARRVDNRQGINAG